MGLERERGNLSSALTFAANFKRRYGGGDTRA